MKKLFTLTLVALLAFAGEANAQLRKTWDFRDGFSQKTVNALAADQEEFGDNKYWRNYEGDATKADEQHYWNASKDAKNSDGYACTHNGGVEKVIPELEGLKLGMSAAKKFVITYNGSTAPNEFESEGGPAIGEPIPHGNSYVWLNGKKETITFQAEVNQKIRIAVESHAVNKAKLGEARGISLSTSAGSLSANFEGSPVPVYYTEYEWELTGTDGDIADVTLMSTNGCHIYYIIVGEGDDPNANKKKVAYLTDGDGAEEEALETLQGNEELLVNVFDVASVTDMAAVMADNQVAVISPKVPVSAASMLKSAIAFYPMVNLNADLYAAWGYGEAVLNPNTDAFTQTLKNDLFAGFEEEADYNLADDLGYSVEITEDEAGYMGLKLGEYFAADDSILVNDGEGDDKLVAVHAHNLYHNGYIYLPFASATEPVQKMLFNAIATLSKEEITQAPAPKISLTYKDQKTLVSMAMASANYKMPKIYYTTDGTDPTEASTLYEDTVTVTEPTLFKAVAIADGYLLSDVTEAQADIYSQPAMPVFSLAYGEGETATSLSCTTEDVTLWYNFSESSDTTKSMKYTDPIIVKTPTTITAFAVAGGMVYSELATKRVTVKNPVVRQDQIGLFDANAAEYQKGGSGSTIYYFSWGKNARSIYDTASDPIDVEVDPETGDEVPVYAEMPYEFYVPSEEAMWEVKSKGQVMIWQNLSAGNDAGNDSGYNPETTGDILSYAKIINHDIQFGGKISGEPCTGAIQSRVKFAGPFDVITHVGTAAGGENVGRMQIQVSKDSVEWTNVGDEMTTSTVKRLWKSYTRSYNETDEVYVRVIQVGGGSSVQIYDMYIMNEGENSKALKEQYEKEYEEAAGGYMLGDVNGDGAVDVSDYIGVANDILGIEQASFNKEAADVDKSGAIDVTDYLGVGNIIHTGSPFGNTDASRAVKKAATNPEDVDNVIYVESFQVEPGTTEATLSVQMKNTAEIRGFQFDLYLPEGVSVTVNAKGKIQGAALNENRLPEDDEHSLTSSKQADGAVRFLCGSQYQETFTGNSGELMTINVKLDEGMANGEYTIAIKNQKLSENDITKSYETELVESILTVGVPTGISQLTVANQNAQEEIYDLQGRRVQNATKGLYIRNGKKVVVK